MRKLLLSRLTRVAHAAFCAVALLAAMALWGWASGVAWLRDLRTAETAKLVVEDALAVQEAGAKMLLVEAVPPEVMKYIWETLTIPVLSIGAGPHCDGQLLIVSDLIGQFQAFTPKFVKKYCNVAEVITSAMKAYVKEVKDGSFPSEDEHCYHMLKGEDIKFKEIMNS